MSNSIWFNELNSDALNCIVKDDTLMSGISILTN